MNHSMEIMQTYKIKNLMRVTLKLQPPKTFNEEQLFLALNERILLIVLELRKVFADEIKVETIEKASFN
mgnify:CR=1 FL=1